MTDINQKLAELQAKAARKHTGEVLTSFEVANSPGWYTLDEYPGVTFTEGELKTLAELRGVPLAVIISRPMAEPIPEPIKTRSVKHDT